MSNHLPFPDVPRPRAAARASPGEVETTERLLALGPSALSTPELLAALLLPGGRRRGAGPRASRLLAQFASLRELAAATPQAIRATATLPPDLAVRVAAAFELGRRVHAARLTAGRLLRSSDDIFEAFGDRLRDLKKERFVAVMLDGRSRVIREDIVSEGILTASLVHPREVFAPAIREAAGSLLLVHNHPSGDPEPSPEDVEITRRLCAVGDIVGIRVVDHVVIGDGSYVSFLDRGMVG